MKSIEAQHGLLIERARRIYSFSHLTFQEYLTARAIVAGTHLSLQQLVKHLSEKRWREVFLLTVQMLPDAAPLLQLMKQQVDAIVIRSSQATATHLERDITTSDEILQQFLRWVVQKSLEVKTLYKQAAVRAFYLTLALPPHHRLAGDQGLALAIDPNLAGELGGDLALDLALTHALAVALTLTPELLAERLPALCLALDLDHLIGSEPIGNALRQLKSQLPSMEEDREWLKQWWQVNGQNWASQLRAAMIEYRHIGHEWQLDQALQQQLEQYSHANKLLVECLNSNCQLTSAVRQEIEEKLVLPMFSPPQSPNSREL